MSWMYGEDYQYAASRLETTVVTHNGKPVLVRQIQADGATLLAPLDGGKIYATQARELDCTPVQLGYVHYMDLLVYCQRMPARRYRQGLSEVTLFCIKNGGGMIHPIPMNFLYDCIVNNYPAYEACVVSVVPMAWHRDWASSSTKLYYKGGLVGKTIKGLPVLNEQYQYLKEALSEDCHAVVRGEAAA